MCVMGYLPYSASSFATEKSSNGSDNSISSETQADTIVEEQLPVKHVSIDGGPSRRPR